MAYASTNSRKNMTLQELKAARIAANPTRGPLKPVNIATIAKQPADFLRAKPSILSLSDNENRGNSDANNNENKPKIGPKSADPTRKTFPTEPYHFNPTLRRISKSKYDSSPWADGLTPDGWEEDVALAALAYMKERERWGRPNLAFPPVASNIRPYMRAILADWLVQVQHHLRLLPSTLYLAMDFVDRFVRTNAVNIGSYQLVGISSIFVAAKIEERYQPEVTELVFLTDHSYKAVDILNMERVVLLALGYRLQSPEPSFFLRIGVDALEVGEKVKQAVLLKAVYFLDLIMSQAVWLKSVPSQLAAAALCLSLMVEQMEMPESVEELLGWRSAEVEGLCAYMAANLVNSGQGQLMGPYHKFSSRSQYGALAHGSWTKCELLESLASQNREPIIP